MDSNLIFPNPDNPNATPMDFILKLCQVACVIAISQVWISGKGMGITMKNKRCVVKPREIVNTVLGILFWEYRFGITFCG
jgi:hypothetical protein